jgi:hypothetical protein
LWFTAYGEQAERLRHENAILCRGTLLPSDLDREVLVTYLCLSEAEHGWTYNRQKLDLAREEVDTCTYAIIHLKHPIE